MDRKFSKWILSELKMVCTDSAVLWQCIGGGLSLDIDRPIIIGLPMHSHGYFMYLFDHHKNLRIIFSNRQ